MPPWLSLDRPPVCPSVIVRVTTMAVGPSIRRSWRMFVGSSDASGRLADADVDVWTRDNPGSNLSTYPAILRNKKSNRNNAVMLAN
jgi:hypothetical protein